MFLAGTLIPAGGHHSWREEYDRSPADLRGRQTRWAKLRAELVLLNASAAASLDEGLEETLTLHRLGVFAKVKAAAPCSCAGVQCPPPDASTYSYPVEERPAMGGRLSEALAANSGVDKEFKKERRQSSDSASLALTSLSWEGPKDLGGDIPTGAGGS